MEKLEELSGLVRSALDYGAIVYIQGYRDKRFFIGPKVGEISPLQQLSTMVKGHIYS